MVGRPGLGRGLAGLSLSGWAGRRQDWSGVVGNGREKMLKPSQTLTVLKTHL